MRILVTTLVRMALIAMPLAAQWLDHRTAGIPRSADGKANLSAPAPRTAEGKPDFTGLWAVAAARADFNTAEVQPWAQALVKQRAEDFGKDSPRYRCMPEGPAYSSSGGMHRILQTPAMIVIMNDDLTYRQIFLDGRALETDPSPNWMGYSVGRWEGDVLVVETKGFNDRTWLEATGYPHTEGLRMTERYRRSDFGHLQMEVKLEDPAIYSRPWTFTVAAQFAADTELFD